MSGTATVRAFHNTAPLAMLDGYQADHEVTRVFETRVMATVDDLALCAQVYRLLNVGDDPEFGTPDPRAVAYRTNGHRSLSVGDVVSVDDRFYAVARFGFDPIEQPQSVS